MNQVNEIRTNENKGFSLIELIVVIAIMAVMAAVLAPSLLAYVERSRAQKDDSAMGEVVNAIRLAMADQDIFDEILEYTIADNSSSYAETETGGTVVAQTADNAVITKLALSTDTITDPGDSSWKYTDEARKKDGTVYKLGGSMTGMRITFNPTSEKAFVVAEAVINATSTNNADVIGDDVPYLYNRVRGTIAEKISISSKTYKNSAYTVFIRPGSTGGNDATAQEAVDVYGQWSGTNLTAADTSFGL